VCNGLRLVMAVMQSLSLALVLVGVLVTSVPDVLPGSNVTVPPNFGALCQQRYLYPQGYSLGACLVRSLAGFFLSRAFSASRQVRALCAAR
jgi:hypothetical protein